MTQSYGDLVSCFGEFNSTQFCPKIEDRQFLRCVGKPAHHDIHNIIIQE